MNRLLMILAGMVVTGCRNCPPEVDLSAPEATIATFRDAFACDLGEVEYRCFADAVKRAFGTYQGYFYGREIFRQDNPLLASALGFTDLEDRIEWIPNPDGVHAEALIDAGGDAPLRIGLVNEPEYVLHYRGGRVENGYAESAAGQWLSKGKIGVVLTDPFLRRDSEEPYFVEIRARWVIESIPGLDRAAKNGGNAP